MKPKLIIFDFDGTLGDTRQNIIMTLQRTMRERGMEVRDDATCASTIGLTLHDSFLRMYPEMSEGEAAECVKHYRDIFYQSIEECIPQLFDGVMWTLQKLRERNIVLSIASSRSSPSLKLFMRSMGIADYFSYILGSDNVERHKPEPEPVLKTLDELGFTPSEAIVVGDMPVDVAMAHNAGVRAVAVSYGNATREELELSGAEVVINNIADLLAYIE